MAISFNDKIAKVQYRWQQYWIDYPDWKASLKALEPNNIKQLWMEMHRRQ